MTGVEEATDRFELSRPELRRRALSGVFFVTSSNFLNLLVGFFGNLALARMLTPHDFGLVALGLTVTLVGGALADGGIGSGLVRRPDPPTRAELRSLSGIQLAIALAICVPVALVALTFGRAGAITAIMVGAIPLTTLQMPGRVVLSRTMRFDRQTVVEFVAQTSFYAFSVTAVALGAGAWGLATGTVVKAAVEVGLVAVLGIGLVLPSFRGWRGTGDTIRFGLRFQASPVTIIAREQALNVVVAAVGGVTALGLWNLANRLIQVPVLAFRSLYAIAFPAMANLLAKGEDVAPVILRMVRRAATVGCLVFSVFAATSPELVPAVFGGAWSDAADVIPWISLSTLILGSISVATTGYLAAADKPGRVAWATAAFGVVWIAVTGPLLPVMGIAAIGVGNLCGALVEATLLDRATLRTAGVAPHRPLLVPLAVALVAGTAGLVACSAGPAGVLTAAWAGAIAAAIAIVGLLAFCRDDVMDLLGLARGTFTSVFGATRKQAAAVT